MGSIDVFIHVPQGKTGLRGSALRCMRELLDLCEAAFQVERELWYYGTDASPGKKLVVVEPAGDESWEQAYVHLSSRACSVVIQARMCTRKGKSMIVNGYAHLDITPHQASTMQGRERTILFEIPETVWRELDRERFIQAVQESCMALGAIYACIDHHRLVPRNLHMADERQHQQEDKYVDPQTRLPGIFWAQLITQRMVARTGPLSYIEKNAPCKVQRIRDEGSSALWLELEKPVEEQTAEERRALRRFLKMSCYDLDVHRLRQMYRRLGEDSFELMGYE